MSVFNFGFGRLLATENISDDVEMGIEAGKGEGAGEVVVPISQAMLPVPLHVYPPPSQPIHRQIKPIPRSLCHQSPQTPTQPPHTLSEQFSTPTAMADNQLVLGTRPSNSVRRRLSDAEDPFAPVEEGVTGNKLLGVLQTTQTQTPVTKCRVIEREDPNKERVIESQASLIQTMKNQLAENNELMQIIRDELKKKDEESLKQQREYEARIRQIEARLQDTESRSYPGAEYPGQQSNKGMQLINPEVEMALAAAAEKQRTPASLEEHKVEPGNSAGRRDRRCNEDDIEMDSDADRRDAGTAQQEPSSPQPVPLRRVPKPMSYKRPQGGKIKLKINPPVPPRLFVDDSEGEEFSFPTPGHPSTSLPTRPTASSASNTDKKLDMLLAILQGSSDKNLKFQATPSPSRNTMYASMFHTPIARGPKQKGRKETLRFIRTHLHSLLGIDRTTDMAKYRDEIFASDTPLQRRMAMYEEHGFGQPDLEPMKINWKVFNGKWNEWYCERFVEYCMTKGLGEGNPNEDELQLVTDIFWERLGRIRTWINQHAPKKTETVEEAEIRNAEQHRSTLECARRNTRRQQAYNSRVDTCLSHLPGEGEPIEESTPAWQDHLDIVETLGVEGQSSDETDEEDPSIYNVRILPWRNRELVKKVAMTDEAKNTTNAYGNPRSGNRPRVRKRRRDANPSQRKVPRGKPLNYYNREWYNKLTPGQKRALGAVPERPFLDTSFDDQY